MSPIKEKEGFTWDANCCINYALRLGHSGNGKKKRPVKSFYSDHLIELLNQCTLHGFQTIYFPFIKEETLRNITTAVYNLADKRGITNFYIISKFVEKGRENLTRLFSKLVKSEVNYSNNELKTCKKLFEDNEIDVTTVLNLQYEKCNIPEGGDLKLIVCAHKQPWGYTYIVSDDGHFIAYEDVLEKSDYSIHIIPMNGIWRRMLNWGWI